MSQSDDLRDTQLLVELTARLITEGDASVLYDDILMTAIALTKADAGTLQLLDQDTQELMMLATHGFDPDIIEHFGRINDTSNTTCGLALKNEERAFIDFEGPQSDDYDGSWRWHLDAGYFSAQSTPLVTRAGKTIGMLSTHWRKRHHRPTERELRFLDLLVPQAADLIDQHRIEHALRANKLDLERRVGDRTFELSRVNETLIAEVQERRAAEERIKRLLRQLVHAQEEERRRIARELHDTLGQQLAALHLSLEIVKLKVEDEVSLRADVERMREIFDRLNSDVDFLAWELRPLSLDVLGLAAALESFVKEWSQQFGIEAGFEAVRMEEKRLAPEVEINLYRIFQEALQNIHKHAAATRVNVVLERYDGHAVLVIEDNGRGYDAEQDIMTSDRTMGVINMRERAALIGGTIDVESEPGAGTTVFVRVPAVEASSKEPE